MRKIAIAAMALLTGGAALADDSHHRGEPSAQAQGPSDTVRAQVRRIDEAAGKVTLTHGALANLGMPGMTMGFPVTDRSMLKAVKPGDTVSATISMAGGDYVVTRLEPSK